MVVKRKVTDMMMICMGQCGIVSDCGNGERFSNREAERIRQKLPKDDDLRNWIANYKQEGQQVGKDAKQQQKATIMMETTEKMTMQRLLKFKNALKEKRSNLNRSIQ